MGRAIAGLLASICLVSHAIGGDFSIADYAKVRRFAEVAISSDARYAAYISLARSGEEDVAIRATKVVDLRAKGGAIELPELKSARAIKWLPDRHVLAFLANLDGTTQIYTYDIELHSVSRVTAARDSVVSYRVSGAVPLWAYITERQTVKPLQDIIASSEKGVSLRVDNIGVADVINPGRGPESVGNTMQLFIQRGNTTRPIEVLISGQVSDVRWSPSGSFLAMVYVSDRTPSSNYRPFRTSVAVVDNYGQRIWQTATRREGPVGGVGYSFSIGDWLDDSKLILLRYGDRRAWIDLSFPEWTVTDPRQLSDDPRRWHHCEIYESGLSFFRMPDKSFLVENTVKGRHSLYQWRDDKVMESDLVSSLGGNNSLFSFSDNAAAFAFVHESQLQPPEIYVYSTVAKERHRVTQENAQLENVALPRVRHIQWASSDNVIVNGSLFIPSDRYPQPWPLVTFLHGGPNYAWADAFAQYFDNWPYPLEVYALSGMAVFIPNYRGSPTFGMTFAAPPSMDGASVDDIVSGIQALIKDGTADQLHLGIIGHSHGAWLGPLVMTRWPRFRAGSFAEGTANKLIMYDLASQELNSEVHQQFTGELYTSIHRYIELSPDLHFDKVCTANLYEVGINSQLLEMYPLAKASSFYHLPYRFVVYPHTRHTIQSPKLQLESAERNFAWLSRWLKHEGDTKESGPEAETDSLPDRCQSTTN